MKLLLDTLDDRREVWKLLAKLPPVQRIRFLHDCCKRVTKGVHAPTPNPLKTPGLVREATRTDDGDNRLTSEVYMDFWALVMDYRLDPAPCVLDLERRVRALR